MTFHSYDKKPLQRRNSDWRSVRLNRYRKPLLVALCCVVLLVYWHQTVSFTSQNEDRAFVQHDPSPLKTKDRRLSHEDLHRKYHDQQSGADGGEKLKAENDIDSDVQAGTKRTQKVTGDKEAVKKHQLDEIDDEDIDITVKRPPPAADGPKQAILDELDTENLPKGPVNVQPDLDPKHQREPLLSSPELPAKEKVIESESDAHLSLEETADSLPEIIHVPFEDVVRDTKLEGWEDEWIARATFDPNKWGRLKEPKIDFVYLWVNGSEDAFQETKRPYEENSVLNDPEGKWISTHGVNRYRDWDELRYSLRSVEKYALSFRNKIQILVNDVIGTDAGKQVPTWLNSDKSTREVVEVLSQKQIFDDEKHVCLPTFNSLTIENQLFNTPSDTDLMYALSDDMLLGKPHSASDIHSPLFGPVMGFKTNQYNTINTPTEADAHRFGEKPFLIYTSWLLNKRFGIRKRKGQGHFGHALSRTVMKEAIGSFPGPELQSACKRFRGEPGFQLYSWFVSFHYLIERHREAMLWSYIMLRSDVDSDGFLGWKERQSIMKSLENGMKNEGKSSYRKRNFYHVIQLLERAGLEGPKVNTDVLWTSLDGPSAIINLDCSEFDVNECLAPGFSISTTDATSRNPVFSTAVIFERLARQKPTCGDCLLKLLLQQTPRGLGPILPDAKKQPEQREVVIKSLMRYRYTISNPDALFVMVTDADQVDSTLTSKYVRGKRALAGQLCLNDDVSTDDEQELMDVKQAMTELYQGLFPEKSPYEK